jgi:hypothetical protein
VARGTALTRLLSRSVVQVVLIERPPGADESRSRRDCATSGVQEGRDILSPTHRMSTHCPRVSRC